MITKTFSFSYDVADGTGGVAPGEPPVAAFGSAPVIGATAGTGQVSASGKATLHEEAEASTDGAFVAFAINSRAAATGVMHENYFGDYYNRIWVKDREYRLSNPRLNVPFSFGVWNAYGKQNVVSAVTSTDLDGITTDIANADTFKRYEYKRQAFTFSAGAPAKVNGSFTFTFGNGSATLDIIATILTALSALPEVPVAETWQWLTTINIAHDGSERRFKVRGSPRINTDLEIVLANDLDRRLFYAEIFNAIGGAFLIPHYQYSTPITEAATVGDDRLLFDPTRTNLRAGKSAIIFDIQREEKSIVKILSIEADGATLDRPLDFDVSKGWFILPAMRSRLPDGTAINMQSIAGKVGLQAQSIEPETVTRDPAATGGLLYFDGLPVLHERFRADNDIDEEFFGGVSVMDNQTGRVLQDTGRPAPYVTGKRQFIAHRPQGMDYWRAFGAAVEGSHKPFLVPTWRADLALVEPPALGAVSLTVGTTDPLAYIASGAYQHIQLETANGVEWRKIFDASEANGNTVITLETPLGVNAGDNEVKVASFMQTMRIADDRITLIHGNLETYVDLNLMAVAA